MGQNIKNDRDVRSVSVLAYSARIRLGLTSSGMCGTPIADQSPVMTNAHARGFVGFGMDLSGNLKERSNHQPRDIEIHLFKNAGKRPLCAYVANF